MQIFISLLAQLNWFTREIDDPYRDAQNKDVIDASAIDGNPIREWAKAIADGIWGIKTADISTFDDAKNTLLVSIQFWINRFIWFLALIAVIYLIIQWIQLLINPKDDEVKKIRTRISTAAWAIWWIWLSWIVVSFIFFIVKRIVWA